MTSRYDPQLIARAAALGVAATLSRQYGVILRAQALAAGMTRAQIDNAVRRGRWRRILPGVYARAEPSSHDAARIWAVFLWAGPGAVIGGRAGMVWHGLLEGLPRLIDVYLAAGRSRREPDGVRVHRSGLEQVDVQRRRGVAVTSVERTGLDLARWGAENDYLDLALRRRATTVDRISRALRRCTGLRTYARARAAADEVATRPWSPVERMLHAALRRAGVIGWLANAAVETDIGTLHPDLAFPELRVAVEVNGRRYHDEVADPDAFERGHRRVQALQRVGWRVLQVTAKQILADVDAIAQMVADTVVGLGVDAAAAGPGPRAGEMTGSRAGQRAEADAAPGAGIPGPRSANAVAPAGEGRPR